MRPILYVYDKEMRINSPVASGIVRPADPALESICPVLLPVVTHVNLAISVRTSINRTACMTFHAFNLSCHRLGKRHLVGSRHYNKNSY